MATPNQAMEGQVLVAPKLSRAGHALLHGMITIRQGEPHEKGLGTSMLILPKVYRPLCRTALESIKAGREQIWRH
jgi:hypothetical protein